MTKRDINFVLIGIILTLFIFGFHIPLLPNLQIDYSLPGSYSEFLTAFGTILTGGVAVTLALWGRTIRNFFYKSNMRLVDHYENIQNTQGQTRLKFINEGKSVAENVIVYIDRIEDNGQIRSDFLPVPLSWTHDGRYMRDFAPKEPWYLDLCRIKNIKESKSRPHLVLAAGQGVPNYEVVFEGNTKFLIRLSHKSGQIRNYEVDLTWKPGKPYATVVRINEPTS